MINTVLIRLDHIHDEAGKIIGVCRCADLIVNNSECVMRFGQIQHGLNKVLSVRSEDPCDPQNEEFLHMLTDSDLALRLCLAVDIERLILVIGLPGSRSVAVKYIVRGEIHHRDVQLFTDLSYILRPVGIDPAAGFRHLLRLIDCRPCRAVDHGITS